MTVALRLLPPDRRANAPVPFPNSIAHDLFAIGNLHRGERDFLQIAVEALAEKRTDLFNMALAGVRVHAKRVADLTAMLESKLAGDDYENSPNVYGG